MLIIFALVFSISSIIISYKMREDYDPHLLIKLIGLFILSIVTISFNTSIPIPIGFPIAYIVSAKSKYDKGAKKAVVLLGFLTTAICTILYYF